MRLVNAEGWPSESVGAMERRPSHALVTGGGGFLGRYIVEQLVARGDRVTTFSRGSYPELAALGARQVRGDLRDLRAITAACRAATAPRRRDRQPSPRTGPCRRDRRAPVDVTTGPIDVVYHVAARAGLWGPYDDFYEANVTGTDNVIEACRATGVRKLVYTSSPSVIFDGTDQRNVDESMPYPNHYESPYPRDQGHRRAAGPRRELLGASNHLSAPAPHLRATRQPPVAFADRARQTGRVPQVGDGTNMVDLTYVEDAAQAHLQAADALEPGSPVAGSVYFISQGEPVVLWPWISDFLARLGLPPIRIRIPLGLARGTGGLLVAIYRSLRLRGEPPLTPFLASELAQDHYYDISRARRDFGYCPRFTMAQATERTLAALTETR